MKKILLSLVMFMFLVSSAFAKVNINTASVDELKELPGIGQSNTEAK